MPGSAVGRAGRGRKEDKGASSTRSQAASQPTIAEQQLLLVVAASTLQAGQALNPVLEARVFKHHSLQGRREQGSRQAGRHV
jgi:hypothetical protein